MVAPLYLAGDVRTKHAEAAAVAADDDRYAPNVAALEKVLPPFVAAADIEISCGTTMLEPHEVEQMITDTLGPVRDLRVTYSAAGGWGVSGEADTYSADFVSVWGTANASAMRVLDAAWSGRQMVITRQDPRYPDDAKRRIVDTEATALAAEKVEKWHDRLNEWMFDESIARPRGDGATVEHAIQPLRSAYLPGRVDGGTAGAERRVPRDGPVRAPEDGSGADRAGRRLSAGALRRRGEGRSRWRRE